MDTMAVTALILCLIFSLLAVEVLTTEFEAVTSSSGEKLCAVDKPYDKVLNVRSVIECGAICKEDMLCETYSFKKGLNECNMYDAIAPQNYSVVPGCSSYKLQGSRPPMKYCSDIRRAASGVATLSINDTAIQVYCDMKTAGGGWLVIQRRMDGSINFYRNWSNYANGFGSLTGEFWLGNDIISLLTSTQRYKLRIDMSKINGNASYAEYDNFTVSSAADNYTLASLGNFSGPAGDSLTGCHLNQTFSTYDKVTSSDGLNRAVTFRGAWWYGNGSCNASNLNGFYYGGPHSTFGDGVEWSKWTGYQYSLKTTEMKIRPV